MNLFRGGCHCGALAVEFESPRAAAELPVRACGCSFCRAHGALSTSDPAGRLRFLARAPELLNRYRFGLKTADFLLCKQCGVYIGAETRSERGAFGVVNVRALDDAASFPPISTGKNYEGETADQRQARREVYWTPVVD
jgi:hypothetical protein